MNHKRIAFILLFLTILPIVILANAAPALYESFTTGDVNTRNSFGTTWRAQTFTVGAVGHTITSVKLKMFRGGSGSLPGTLTVGIRATAAGLPTGADLTNGTLNGNDFTTDTNGAWYEITLTEIDLTATNKYAIVCRATSGNSNNYVGWRTDATSPPYADGSELTSTNSGVDWTEETSYDMMFEVYGNALSSSYSGKFNGKTMAKFNGKTVSKWCGSAG